MWFRRGQDHDSCLRTRTTDRKSRTIGRLEAPERPIQPFGAHLPDLHQARQSGNSPTLARGTLPKIVPVPPDPFGPHRMTRNARIQHREFRQLISPACPENGGKRWEAGTARNLLKPLAALP